MTPADEPSAAHTGDRGRPSALRSANLVIRLACELGLLVALGVWGFHTGRGIAAKLVLGVGAPLLAAVAWGLWVAPASRRRLADPLRLAVEVLLFAPSPLPATW